MRNTFLFVFLLVHFSFSQAWPPVTNFTYYWNPLAGDTVTFAKWDANNDSVRAATGRIITEMNSNVVHFNQGTANHDSVIHYVRIDTIRSNPDVDSITGNPFIDTVTTRKVAAGITYSDSVYSSGSIVAAENVEGDSGIFNYIKVGSEVLAYDTGTFLCSLVGPGPAGALVLQKSATAYYTKTGQSVTIELDSMTFTNGVYGTSDINIMGIPAATLPRTAAHMGAVNGLFFVDGSEIKASVFLQCNVGAIDGNLTHVMTTVAGQFGTTTKKGWGQPISFTYSINIQ